MNRTTPAQRRLFACLTVLFLAVLVAAALWTPLYAQDGSLEEEPNDRSSRATSLTLEEPVEATISPAGDADWFRFDAPASGELRFAVEHGDPDAPIWVRVWNGDLAVIKDWVTAEEDESLDDFVDLAAPGPHFLEIISDTGASSQEPYILTVDFTPIVDPNEPNNRFGEATWIGDMESLQANLLPAGDVDWYALDVDDAGELSLEITDVPEEMSLYVRVWNADRQVIADWISPGSAGETTTGIVDLPSSGAYYLEVIADTGERSAQPYTFTWDFTPTGDAHEPNDRFSLATALPPGEETTATIFPLRDVDIYAIEVPAQGELAIAITDSPAALDINMRLWNPNLDVLHDWVAPAAGEDNQATFDLPTAGTYFLEVIDDYSDTRSVEPYTIASTFTATNDAAEPNDLFSQATPLDIGEEVHATILPLRDHDWYVVEIDEAGLLAVGASDAPEALDISLRLWNGDKNVVVDWAIPPSRGEETVLVAEIIEPGRYFIEVVDGYDDARSVEPFVLRVDFVSASEAAADEASAEADATEESPAADSEEADDTSSSATSGIGDSPQADDEEETETTEDESAVPEPEDAAAPTITLEVPEGWVREDGDEIVVRLQGDEGGQPGAPLLRIQADDIGDDDDILSILEGEDALQAILEEPDVASVSGMDAVTLGVQEIVDGEPLNRRYLLVNAPNGEAFLIVLEAGPQQWEDYLPDLEAMLESIEIDAQK